MAKYFTIPGALYAGRNLTIVDYARGPGQGPVETDRLGYDKVACIAFTAPQSGTVQVAVTVVSDAKWKSDHPFGIEAMLSVTETKADFTHNARAGLNPNLQGKVGGYPRAGIYVELTAGKQYYANVAHIDPASANMELSAQLTFM